MANRRPAPSRQAPAPTRQQQEARLKYRGTKAAGGTIGNPVVPYTREQYLGIRDGAYYISSSGVLSRKGNPLTESVAPRPSRLRLPDLADASAQAERFVAPIEQVRRDASRALAEGGQALERGLQDVGRNLGDAVRKRADVVGSNASDMKRDIGRWIAEVTPQPDRMRQNVAGNLEEWRRRSDLFTGRLAALPEKLGETLEANLRGDRAPQGIPEDQTYFLRLNPYETRQQLTQNRIADPRSPEASEAKRRELDFRQALGRVTLDEWENTAEWKKPLWSTIYGAQDGGFGIYWDRKFGEKRSGDDSEEGYRAEQLRRALARERYPGAYATANAVAGTAAEMLKARHKALKIGGAITDGLNDFAEGALSEAGEGATRLSNGLANLGIGLAADEIVKPLGDYAKRRLVMLRQGLPRDAQRDLDFFARPAPTLIKEAASAPVADNIEWTAENAVPKAAKARAAIIAQNKERRAK